MSEKLFKSSIEATLGLRISVPIQVRHSHDNNRLRNISTRTFYAGPRHLAGDCEQSVQRKMSPPFGLMHWP